MGVSRGRIASSIRTTFDGELDETTGTNFPDWDKVALRKYPNRVSVSEGVHDTVFDRVCEEIQRVGGEVGGVMYLTTRINPISVVVTILISSPSFGVQRLARVAFDPHEVKIVVADDGREEVHLVDECAS